MRSIIYFNSDQIPHLILRFRWKHSPLICISQTSHLCFPKSAEPINQHQMMFPYLSFLLHQLIPLECLYHLYQPLFLDLFGHIILHSPMRVCLLSHRVSEEEGHVILHLLYQGECIRELLLCLVAETADEVG